MSELRRDPITGRWVIISTDRNKRLSDFRLESVAIEPDEGCPFCEGHEALTPRRDRPKGLLLSLQVIVLR